MWKDAQQVREPLQLGELQMCQKIISVVFVICQRAVWEGKHIFTFQGFKRPNKDNSVFIRSLKKD